GLPSADMKALHAAGKSVPRPVVVKGIIDSGSNHCCISKGVANLLGLQSLGTGSTQTAGGSVYVDLYEVSLFIPKPGSTTEYLTVADGLLVSELDPNITGFETLVGRDLLARLLLFLNGPSNQYTLAG